ncbi:MAG: hypothetical protein M1818_000259 [Claussenomyces sp. TS43310]|nr:MAG: hypothetical protein M1818_000259 [Claussenomyces sp. TS43310]
MAIFVHTSHPETTINEHELCRLNSDINLSAASKSYQSSGMAEGQGTLSQADPSSKCSARNGRSLSSLTPSLIGAAMIITEDQLNNTFTYALDRGNGIYTRLLPADMIPEMGGLQMTTRDSSGMIVLPYPRLEIPRRELLSHGIKPRRLQHGDSSTSYDASAHSVGSQDATFSRTSSGAQFKRSLGSLNKKALQGNPVQGQINQILSRSGKPENTAKKVSRVGEHREKTYCDMWLHRGTCAFAQQGCKYKHEMPLDRQTQHSVGLFQGLPEWYKRAQVPRLIPQPLSASGATRSLYRRLSLEEQDHSLRTAGSYPIATNNSYESLALLDEKEDGAPNTDDTL